MPALRKRATTSADGQATAVTCTPSSVPPTSMKNEAVTYVPTAIKFAAARRRSSGEPSAASASTDTGANGNSHSFHAIGSTAATCASPCCAPLVSQPDDRPAPVCQPNLDPTTTKL